MTTVEQTKRVAKAVRDYVHYFGATQNADGSYSLNGREGKLEEWIERALLPPEEAKTEMLHVVRLFDGFDGVWMDVSEPMPQAEAEKLAGDKNEARVGSAAGKREGSYSDIDYYKAFPVDTRMVFSGDNSLTGRGD